MNLKRILIAGPLDAASQTFVRQLSADPTLNLTVYTPSQVTLPEAVTGFTEETLDEGGLSAAMLDQDLVVALAPTIHLVETVKTVVTAARAVMIPRVLVSRTDEMEGLPRDVRTARQLLLTAGMTTDLVEGLGSLSALLGVMPAPAEVDPLFDARVAG